MPERLEMGGENKTESRVLGRLRPDEKPDAFTRKIELLTKAGFSKVEARGEENLELIPPDRNVVFVTTHITDSDVPLAISVLGKKFHLAAGDASTHRKFSENTFAFIGTALAGSKNFLSVSHRDDPQTGETGVFDPEDFRKMQNVFENGKAVVMAAYYKSQNKGLKLPEKGGYGAAYLAELTNAVVVPVAINVRSKENIHTAASIVKATLSRPEAEVVIGYPFEPQAEDLTAIGLVAEKRKRGEYLDKDDVEAFRAASGRLREQSDVFMRHLAELLPEEKRGDWK